MQLSGLSVKHITAMLLVAVLPAAAQASPVYLLQLGSYDNLQEARARWGELKNKYPDLLKDFSARFQDVNLPPDNFVVYRTQAGALKEKADAERVCERITSRGDECYVVETAIFRPDLTAKEEPPLSIVNAIAPDGTVQAQSKLPDMAQNKVDEAAAAVNSAAQAGGEIVKAPTMTRRVVTPGVDMPAMPKPELPSKADIAKSEAVARMPRPVAPPLAAAPSMAESSKSMIGELPDMAASRPSMPAVAMPSVPVPTAPTVQQQALSIGKPALKISKPALKSDLPVPAMPVVEAKNQDLPKTVPFARAMPDVKAPAIKTPDVKAPSVKAIEPAISVPVSVPQVEVPAMPSAPMLSSQARTDVARADAPKVVAPSLVAPTPAPMMPAGDKLDATIDNDKRSAQVAAQNIVFPEKREVKAAVKKAEPKASAKESESFWSMINPFASDETLAKDEIIIEKPESDDKGGLLSSLDPFRSGPDKDANFPPKAPKQQARQAEPRPIDPETAVKPSAKEVAAFGFPPPPAPSNDQTMQVVREQRDAAQARRASLEPAPAKPQVEMAAPVPVVTSSAPNDEHVLKAPPQANAPVKAPEVKRKTATGADVEVAEAVRVPLSERKNPLPLDQTMSTKLPATGTLKKMGTPSTLTDEKTLWAQIYYFDSQQTALAYWEAFRKQNPSFPPVRVRVTSPYNNTLGHEKRVSLRIGPFDLASQVNDLCEEVQSHDMSCKAMSEVGGSTVAQFSREHGGTLSGRYEQAQALQAGGAEPMYWVQLGSFATQGKAEDGWNKLTERHKPLLDKAKSNVASPIMSSAMEPIYRLRTGPYAMRNSADQLCANMKASGSDCVVVFSR